MASEKNTESGSNIHVPVLLEQVLESFAPIALKNKNPVFVDGTLGGAGHTTEILKKFTSARLLGCDYDLSAIEAARKNHGALVESGRLGFYHGNFSTLNDSGAKYPDNFEPDWDGILLDLGYSSNQLEDPEYGMSFMTEDAALDMRLSRPPSGDTAWDLLVSASESDLADIFYHYGEMEDSRRVARKIKEAIASGELKDSTKDFAHFVSKVRKSVKSKIHPATLAFQALRIAVNDELRSLDHFLNNVTLRVKEHGRVSIITFHSIEDRIVKQWGQANRETFDCITRKPIEATDNEVALNPRSRSAKLRVYERRSK